ncbi:AraC family ligand binding domain-containing protein [Streptomyces sp. NPDC019224]|uniref:AraC family ligand binding domain-containing protein n=1 Tax=Streptomyces sp. NPDC019224 TaxID=3154484 RepID=UPI0033D6A693
MTSTILTRLSGHGFRRPGEVVALRQELVRPHRPHWHDFHEMALVTAGSGIHHVDGRTLPLTRGDVLVISPSPLHAVAPAPGQRLELIDVTFDAQTMPREVEKMLSTLTSGGPVVAQVPDPALFDALADETTGSRPHRQIMARALVSQAVVSLARDRSGASSAVQLQTLVASVRPALAPAPCNVSAPALARTVSTSCRVAVCSLAKGDGEVSRAPCTTKAVSRQPPAERAA